MVELFCTTSTMVCGTALENMSETESTDAEAQKAKDGEDIVQRSGLIALVGDHAKARIINALLDSYGALNPASIADKANIDPSTWYDHVDDLTETGLIEKAGNAGNSPLYQIDPSDPRADALSKVRDLTAAEIHDRDE